MTPAIEYLIRTGLIRDWLVIPCSLFLYENETFRKKVVTVGEEFKPSRFYSVKHWNVGECSPEQALPSMTEYRVRKEELFSHPAVILPGYRLMSYTQESVVSGHNSYKKPMSAQLYSHFFDNTLDSLRHFTRRTNWLWGQFVRIYARELCATHNYISSVFRSEAEVALDQRDIVYRLLKKEWQYWLAWQEYLMHAPGELVFYKEYRSD
jgi:hypothetical protein